MTGWLAYIFLRLWINPQTSDIELIYSLSILVIFEFLLVHSGAFMSILGRSWKGWVGFGIFYGLFALAFNTMVRGNEIIILYGAVVLNRMLPKLLNSEQTDIGQGLMMAMINASIYLVLIFAVLLGSSYIPQFGMTEAFLNSVAFGDISSEGIGFFDEGLHVVMCFGVLYYLTLMLVEINVEIHRIKAALAPSTDSSQTLKKETEIEKPKATIIAQFDKSDNDLPPGCGCSPWLVFVFAAVFIAIGVYQIIDSKRVENNEVVHTTGVVGNVMGSFGSKKGNLYIATISFTAEGKEYTFTHEYKAIEEIRYLTEEEKSIYGGGNTIRSYDSPVHREDTISVVYPPNRPQKAIVAGTETGNLGENLFLWIGIIIILAFTALMLIGKLMNIKNKQTKT